MTEDEREEVVRYAAASFAADLLGSIDDLERAIASVTEDQRSNPVVAGLLTGVEATRHALLDTLSRHGLRRLDPLGHEDPPSGTARDCQPDPVDRRAHLGGDAEAAVGHFQPPRERLDRACDLLKRGRIE